MTGTIGSSLTINCNYTGASLNDVVWIRLGIGSAGEVISSGSMVMTNFSSIYSINTATSNIVKLTINSVTSKEFTYLLNCLDHTNGKSFQLAQISSAASTGMTE